VAEELLASQEGLFFVILIVSNCNDLTVIVLKISKAAAVLSVLMKVYSIACHDRGQNVMLVLQSCTDSLHIKQGSSNETHSTSDGACNISSVNIEEVVEVIEESFIAINKKSGIGIKQEEIPEDINFPDIKVEPDEVSYVCVSVIRQILPVSSNINCFCDLNISGQLKQFLCWERKGFTMIFF